MIPAVSSDAYTAARRHAAVLDRSDRGRIVVSGADRRSYLHGLLTNDIAALTAGHGCYAAYLTAQGRMIADLWIYELGDVVLLSMSGDVKDTMLARLDQFIFAEDVQLGDVTDTFAQIALVGPDAARVLSSVISSLSRAHLDALPEHGNVRADWNGSSVIVTRITDVGPDGFDVYVERAASVELMTPFENAGAVALDHATAEVLRIESGVPLFHRDMDEETIPLEAGIEARAISFTKGCYVGQEVIVRVLHRGHGRIARRLVGLKFGETAEPPVSGAVVRVGDREIGNVTSAAVSPALQAPIALAYVHRDFVEPGTSVTVGGVDGTVMALPFVSDDSRRAAG